MIHSEHLSYGYDENARGFKPTVKYDLDMPAPLHLYFDQLCALCFYKLFGPGGHTYREYYILLMELTMVVLMLELS